MRALTIVCGMLALAAAASAQAVTNVPPSGERVTFANDPSVATTGAISIVDADGWTWVVYGTTAGLSWYNASCGMQGVPLEASFSQTGCFATTTMASPVSSLGKFNASNFFAVAGDSIAIFTGKTAGNVISAPGAIFDLAVTAYPSNQQRLAPGPTVVNGFLYIGTQNLTLGGTMSMVHKINLVTGTMVWSQAVAWANSNYPVTVGTINGVSTVIATSASPSIAVFTPIMDSTGALGNASFVTSVVESACAGWSYCNQTQFGVAIVNDLVWIVSSQMYHRIIVWSPATQQWASTSSQSTNTNTQFLSVVDGWLLLGQNTYVYAVNASAMPMSALTSTTGSIPSSIIFQAQTTSGGWYSSYVQAVFVVNNTLYAAHQCGIDAININTLLAGGTPTMSAWWTYWSTAASSSYSTCGRLQMAWMDVMTPTTLYVTYGTLGSSYTQGSTWAFDMAKNMSLWRFGDNYNALGGSIWVMPKGLSTGLWFGATAGASAGPYGRRTLLGWTASSMQGSVTLNVATSSTNPTMAYSNVSGMLMVSNGYNFTIYNASTLQLFATVQSTGNYFQAYGFVTVGTWHCAVTTYTMHCLDFKMGNSSSYTVSNSFYNVPIVAGNRYIIAWHYSNGVVVLDTWATTASFSDPLPKGGSSWVVGQVAASIVQDTLVVAVTYDTGKMRVYYGATGAVYTEIAGGTAAGVTKSVSLTSNAVIQNGYAVASATVTSTSTVTSSTTTGFIFVPLTTVPVSLTTAPTAAETVAWIYGSQEDSGTLQTVFASPNDPTMVYGLSASNLTGWSTKTMKPVFTVQPPVNTSFLTATRRQPTSQYWPTVDNTTGLLIIGLNDANSGTFTAYGLFGPNDGALEGLVGVKVTGSSWTPPATPQFSGNGLVYPSVTHICDGSVSPWNFSWPMNGIDNNDRRVCTTIDGVTTTDGFAVANNTFYLLVGGNVLTASRVDATGYYTRLYVAGAAGGNNGNGGGSSTGDDGGSGSSKAPIIIGIIVAVVVVALVGFVVFKKMGSSGGSSGQSGVNYSEMSTKKV